MADERAIKILFDTYWSSTGWKAAHTVNRADFEYAKAAHVMFDSINLTHDEIVQRATRAADHVSRNDVVSAFVSSLATRRLEMRSALGSYAVGRQLFRHELTSTFICPICGEVGQSMASTDLNILNFERFKWGGVRHSSPTYIWFDLERFASEAMPELDSQGVGILRAVFKRLSELTEDSRARDAEQALKLIVGSNKSEREMLINIFGFCGILQPRDQASFLDSFIEYKKRDIPPGVNKIDWQYPISWWRGRDGVNEKAVEFWFGKLL